MITNITTGSDEYRLQKKLKPFYVTWQDKGQRYYAYFPIRYLAEAYKDKMIKETTKN